MLIEIPDNIIYKEIGDEGIVLDIGTGYYFLLNSVANRMLKLMLEAASADEVIDALMAEYRVSRQELEEDLNSLIGQLKGNGIVKEAS